MPLHRIPVLPFIALLAAAAGLAAKPIPGPKGGRVVTTESPHVEFFVEKDRTVTVTFYDQDFRPVVPSGQRVSAVAETDAGKVVLTFSTQAGAFRSSAPLPAGEGYRVVLQVRASAQGRPINYRLELHEELCGECGRAEYACICDH